MKLVTRDDEWKAFSDSLAVHGWRWVPNVLFSRGGYFVRGRYVYDPAGRAGTSLVDGTVSWEMDKPWDWYFRRKQVPVGV